MSYIGGDQPAWKWLKDGKGRALSVDDVRHDQRILKILSETNRVMQTNKILLGTATRPHRQALLLCGVSPGTSDFV